MATNYQAVKFDRNYLCILFSALLPFEKAIQETAKYCFERKAFGRPLLDNQFIQYRLAELKAEVELLRSLTYRATGL